MIKSFRRLRKNKIFLSGKIILNSAYKPASPAIRSKSKTITIELCGGGSYQILYISQQILRSGQHQSNSINVNGQCGIIVQILRSNQQQQQNTSIIFFPFYERFEVVGLMKSQNKTYQNISKHENETKKITNEVHSQKEHTHTVKKNGRRQPKETHTSSQT